MTLVSDLKDRGVNPAESPYECLLEVDTDERHAIIVWTEMLAFHSEYNGAREYPATAGYPAWSIEDTWAPLVDENGWLTGQSLERLEDELERLILTKIDSPALKVWSQNPDDDGEPSVTFEVVTDYAEGETYEAWLDRIGWPIISTLINVTDPGTFMSPYLFDTSIMNGAS